MMLYFNWPIGFSAGLRSGLVAGWFIDLIPRATICPRVALATWKELGLAQCNAVDLSPALRSVANREARGQYARDSLQIV
jgi:hypothetical protein